MITFLCKLLENTSGILKSYMHHGSHTYSLHLCVSLSLPLTLTHTQVIFGVPPQKRKKKTLAGFDEPERNPIADMILEEKSTNWSETR